MPTGSLILPRDIAHKFLWYSEVTPPSKLDTCDGELKLWACLSLQYRLIFDDHFVRQITRRVCPQHFRWHWMVDTDANSEIEGSGSTSECKAWVWKPHATAPNHVIGKTPGLEYSTKTFALDTDPPFGTEGSADDEDYAMAMRPHGKGARFRWYASIVSVSVPATPVPLPWPLSPLPVPEILAGIGSQDLPFDIQWAIWLKAEDVEMREILGRSELEPFNVQVDGLNVRVLVEPYIDQNAIPNMAISAERTVEAKNLFESSTGLHQSDAPG